MFASSQKEVETRVKAHRDSFTKPYVTGKLLGEAKPWVALSCGGGLCRLHWILRKYFMRSGIAIVVEGLHTGLIGAYGSNTAVTQAIDRLAAYGLVLDQCFVDSLDFEQQLRSLWTGRHALQRVETEWSLWQAAADSGLACCLITDCPIVARVAEQLGCPRVTFVAAEASDEPASDWTECALMQVFAAAVEEIEAAESESESMIWIHSRGLRLPWDAPIEFRCRFIDPEDPDPPCEARIPDIAIDKYTDPDEIVGWSQVAAAQVAVVDRALEVVLTTLEAREDAAKWSTMLLSLGGVPLGEHGRVGWGAPQLFGEEMSCVAIVRPASWLPLGQRRAELCQIPDLLPTWLAALAIETALPTVCWGDNLLALGPFTVPMQWPAPFQIAFAMHSDGTTWIRTPAWSSLLQTEDRQSLFVKPDDRWEVSDVATRRVELVEQLRELSAVVQHALANDARHQLPTLSEELCNLIR